jgi:hypothetical protein
MARFQKGQSGNEEADPGKNMRLAGCPGIRKTCPLDYAQIAAFLAME